MKFSDETIVVTDPCYLMKDVPDWDKCSLGSRLFRFGFTSEKTKVSRTGWGDGVWEIFNENTKEIYGQFAADSGQTGIFSLDEILRYNPDFLDMKHLVHLATIFWDFTGDIDMKFKKTKLGNEEIVVFGKGISKQTFKTDIPISFTSQLAEY